MEQIMGRYPSRIADGAHCYVSDPSKGGREQLTPGKSATRSKGVYGRHKKFAENHGQGRAGEEHNETEESLCFCRRQSIEGPPWLRSGSGGLRHVLRSQGGLPVEPREHTPWRSCLVHGFDSCGSDILSSYPQFRSLYRDVKGTILGISLFAICS